MLLNALDSGRGGSLGFVALSGRLGGVSIRGGRGAGAGAWTGGGARAGGASTKPKRRRYIKRQGQSLYCYVILMQQSLCYSAYLSSHSLWLFKFCLHGTLLTHISTIFEFLLSRMTLYQTVWTVTVIIKGTERQWAHTPCCTGLSGGAGGMSGWAGGLCSLDWCRLPRRDNRRLSLPGPLSSPFPL